MSFCYGEKDSYEVAESILKALIDRPKFGTELNKKIVDWSHKLIEFAKRTAVLPLDKYSNKQLWELYLKHDQVHTKLYTYGWLPVCVDMFHNNFTKKLKQYLYGICESKQDAESAFIAFTTPDKKTIVASEREEFLIIYDQYRKFIKLKTIPQSLKQVLVEHAKKWGHLGYIYAGNTQPFSWQHYWKEMGDLAKTGIEGRKVLKKEAEQLRNAKIKRIKLYRKLKVSPLYRRLFDVATDFALTKLVRRHAQLLDLLLMHKTLLTEIANRLKLTRYQVQFMLMDEVKKALLQNKVNQGELKNRLRHCVTFYEKNSEHVYLGKFEEKIRKTINTTLNKNLKELTGQVAQPGMAKGIVKIIIRAKDMKKMNKGDILVSIATDPDIVSAMKKAAAIVTEQGGITSHAAIVSRELGTPCVIGTRFATQVFKDGDFVEVDANKGIVRKLGKK
ncbi:MAG: hypothetical protein HYW51_03200 [Candidatus Doudnabacteria bacterium]|nr:hypothetical protein [Candidatus Doudnabacteria bacterium]